MGGWIKKISALLAKTTPVDADLLPLGDSADGYQTKKLTWANLNATLKTDFDTRYLLNSLATGANQFLASSGAGVWLAKSQAELRQLLGVVSPEYYGAVADGLEINDAGVDLGAPTHLMSATAGFTSADVGKIGFVEGAGAAGVTLYFTISSILNGTTAIMNVEAATAVSNALCVFGTDDTAALQAAIDACGADRALSLQEAIYCINSVAEDFGLTLKCEMFGVTPKNSTIWNVGPGSAVLMQGPAGTMYYYGWHGFAIRGNLGSQDGLVTSTGGAVLGTETAYCSFRDIEIRGHGRHGLIHRFAWSTRYDFCKSFENGGLGLWVIGGDRNNLNGGGFYGCEFRFNGGTGNQTANLFAGGVRIEECTGCVFIGGVVEYNNAWGFIIGSNVAGLHLPAGVYIDGGMHLEDNPREDCDSTEGGQIKLWGKWDNVSVCNCWLNYALNLTQRSWRFYVESAGQESFPQLGTAQVKFTERNNYSLIGEGDGAYRDFCSGPVLWNQGETRQNLLKNSGFALWSNGALANVGDQITVTGITAGVCATADTEGLAVGKLVKFGAGGSTANLTYEVTAVVANTSFTIHNTSITDATEVTCYEVTPGCIAADALGPDGWSKEYTATQPDLWREFQGANVKGFYGLKITSMETAASHGLKQILNKSDAVSANGFQHLLGRTVTFGCWVKADAVGVAELQIYDRVASPVAGTTTQSRKNLSTGWEWLEVTRTFPTSVLDRAAVYLVVNTTGHTVYFAQPMAVFGDSIGYGNYAAPANETVWLEAPVTLTNFNGATDTTARTAYIQAETLGKLGKGVKALTIYNQVSGAASSYIGWRQTSASATRQAFIRAQVAGVINDSTMIIPLSADTAYFEAGGGVPTYTVKVNGVSLI